MKRNSPTHVPPDRGGESHDAPSPQTARNPGAESPAVSVTGATGQSKVENLEATGLKNTRCQVQAGVIHGDVHVHSSSPPADKGRHDRYEAHHGDVVPYLLEEKVTRMKRGEITETVERKYYYNFSEYNHTRKTTWICSAMGEIVLLLTRDIVVTPLNNLLNLVRRTYNTDLESVEDGSLIFVFMHETEEDALRMMKDQTQVKPMLLEFIHTMNTSVRDIEINVEMRKTNQSTNPVESEYDDLHIDSVTGLKHREVVDAMQHQITDLERKVKELEKNAEAETRMMLWMRSDAPSLSETSGHYSGEGDTESVSDAVSEGGHRSDTEGKMPHLTSKWEIQEGNMKLIYYDRNHMLNEACREGKLEIVKNILSTGSADINNKSQGGWTPVLLAANTGRKDIFDVLVKKGCNLSAVLDNGNNILHVSCLSGNTDITEYLTAVVSIDSKGMYGRTAVMKAAAVGNKNVFDLLVGKGCDLSAVDDGGYNILHLACFSDNVYIVEHLITHKIADIESRGNFGRTPVMCASWVGRQKVFDLLVGKGCDLSAVDDDGNNILHIACFGGNVYIVEYLITHNTADIESRGNFGTTPVMAAAEKGQQKVFDLLVGKGCNLSAVDGKGNNILHFASFSDNVHIVEYLITHKIADIESRGEVGRTPVMFAAEKGKQQVFYLLVGKGCNLSAVDDGGDNILHLACFSDNVHIVDYLITHNTADIESRGRFGRTPVLFAAETGKQQVFDLLVGKGCDLSAVDDGGNNILHLACVSGNVHIVGYLITHKVADIESRGRFGRTPVMTAAEMGNQKVFDLLVGKGCSLSAVDDDGNNTLHHAAYAGTVGIVNRLLSESAVEVSATNNRGETPLQIALRYNQGAIVKILRARSDTLL
ncbi:serine/threonine-protein phosphatase 6 regulatory ankyrin repeat subunit B-like isoform X2 [Haliotis rufescens]|uniref:serine/threonine-protein phosphatase 6 regulatory ankyrin repeat subunit B-like isoform X2 n=1 Tax=Haliotis rufescens TaxID=6454 RepID=UPI00201E8776|nr:serine/threonine-protein phosphatase 6 regulatory ankyrin repeat subunit B-like isoform X2 [Haliotis rufescens]